MRIGVIGAMQIEVDNLKASMSDISTKEYSGVTYVCGTCAGVVSHAGNEKSGFRILPYCTGAWMHLFRFGSGLCR